MDNHDLARVVEAVARKLHGNPRPRPQDVCDVACELVEIAASIDKGMYNVLTEEFDFPQTLTTDEVEAFLKSCLLKK